MLPLFFRGRSLLYFFGFGLLPLLFFRCGFRRCLLRLFGFGLLPLLLLRGCRRGRLFRFLGFVLLPLFGFRRRLHRSVRFGLFPLLLLRRRSCCGRRSCRGRLLRLFGFVLLPLFGFRRRLPRSVRFSLFPLRLLRRSLQSGDRLVRLGDMRGSREEVLERLEFVDAVGGLGVVPGHSIVQLRDEKTVLRSLRAALGLAGTRRTLERVHLGG